MEAKEHMNIFIIDDNKMFALLLKTELENSFSERNFVISTFESGEACENMLHLEPDLVLVDYHLDSTGKDAMNGIEVIDMIRKHCPETDFIMITMDEHTELFLRSKNHDIYDYLIKSPHIAYKLNLSVSHWLNLKN